MTAPHPLVTLLTDFGGRDGYVAAMKGVIATLAPNARVLDAAHDVPPQDVQAAAWTLLQYWSLYPVDTIHVAVVDPGVGTDRKGLVVEADQRILVVPDNGLASLVLEQAYEKRVHAIRADVHRPGVLSATFHGRDVFAYVAGLLASRSRSIADLTVRAEERVHPCWARPQSTSTRIEGEVIYVDHFGNLITNIPSALMPDAEWAIATVRLGAKIVTQVRRTYADVEAGAILALFGSSNTLEIAVNAGSAQNHLHAGRGTRVVVEKGLLAAGGTRA